MAVISTYKATTTNKVMVFVWGAAYIASLAYTKDLHWAVFCTHLAGCVLGVPIVLLLTFYPTETGSAMYWLWPALFRGTPHIIRFRAPVFHDKVPTNITTTGGGSENSATKQS